MDLLPYRVYARYMIEVNCNGSTPTWDAAKVSPAEFDTPRWRQTIEAALVEVEARKVETERLRAEVEQLRAALTEVIEAEEWPFSDAPPWGCALVRCYLALGREPGDGAPDELRAAYQSEKAAQERGG